LLGDFNAIIRKEDIYIQASYNDSLRASCNDNEVVNFAGHCLMERLRIKLTALLLTRSGIAVYLIVQSFELADYDSQHCLAVEEVRERLVMNKQRSHRLLMFGIMGKSVTSWTGSFSENVISTGRAVNLV
jgi:hypothetical protein